MFYLLQLEAAVTLTSAQIRLQETAEATVRAALQRADAVEAEAIGRLAGHLRGSKDTAERAVHAEGRAAHLERQLAEAAARHQQVRSCTCVWLHNACHQCDAADFAKGAWWVSELTFSRL